MLINMKCYEYYAKYEKHCKKSKCRYWLNSKENQNCTINCAKKGASTLQQIGVIYDITRMRVCQIEKNIINKIKKRANNMLSNY
jgi:DNA-directed RNA polymerase sigma subunit (sigma70/sigma32)